MDGHCVDDGAERIYDLTALGFKPGVRVPVTAKLSRQFYERLGDDIATELVDWFNAVDLTYQTQLKEINDLNWERFKAELLAVDASIRGELRAEAASIRGELHSEFASIRGEMQSGLASVRGEMQSGFAALSGELRTTMAEMRAEMSAMRAELHRWMFIYWSGLLVALGGLLVGLETFLR